MFNITPELDAALDGQAKWIYSIVLNYTRKHKINLDEAEEVFADFVVFYLGKRGQYDETRGRMTTFVFQVFRSYAFHKGRKKKIKTQNVAADVANPCIVFDRDEIELIEQFQVTRRESASRLAKDLGRSERHVEETLDSLRAKVAKRNERQRAVVCK